MGMVTRTDKQIAECAIRRAKNSNYPEYTFADQVHRALQTERGGAVCPSFEYAQNLTQEVLAT